MDLAVVFPWPWSLMSMQHVRDVAFVPRKSPVGSSLAGLPRNQRWCIFLLEGFSGLVHVGQSDTKNVHVSTKNLQDSRCFHQFPHWTTICQWWTVALRKICYPQVVLMIVRYPPLRNNSFIYTVFPPRRSLQVSVDTSFHWPLPFHRRWVILPATYPQERPPDNRGFSRYDIHPSPHNADFSCQHFQGDVWHQSKFHATALEVLVPGVVHR